jgi:hypothetical protein
MKKLTAVLIFILFFCSFQNALAKSTPSAQIINVQYNLPYTGILPDSPLYFLKALRDNLLGLLINDPLKKAEFDLLMANKRLGGAEALLKKGKNDLAITTLSKSGNYFFHAIEQVRLAKRQGQNVNDLVDKLITASLKHQQVIFQMIEETNPGTKQVLESSIIRVRDFELNVEKIKSI